MNDVHQLKVFAAVAQNLSFTRAAEGLFLTQSAVSHQIAALERELGTPLFERRGRSISVTAAGKVLLDRSRRIFAALDEAAAATRAAARPESGRLRIGASSTACQYFIPESLREFRESFPEYSLSVIPGDSPVIAEKLMDESIDLGVMVWPEQRFKLDYHPLFEDELGFLLSPLHPWAKAGKVDKRELASQRMVLYSQHSATFRMVERYFARMNTPLRDWIELGSMEAIKELVELGLGISIIAPWIAQAEIAERSLVWLPPPGGRLKRRWCIAHLRGRRLGIAEQTFIGLCQSVGRGLPIATSGGGAAK